MLVKGNKDQEEKIVKELISSNSELKRQHELFQAEMKFKQTLIDARKKMSLTQQDISDLTGLSQQAVSRLEKGNGGNIETVIRYLSAIGMTLAITSA